MNNKWTCQFNGSVYHVSNYSINRMLLVLRYRGIDLQAYNGYRGMTLITLYPIVSKMDGNTWSIVISQ